MPADNQKILSIMMAEIRSIEDRCPGYREELGDTLAEIIGMVRDHKVNRTNIDQRVADKVNATGRFLFEGRQE